MEGRRKEVRRSAERDFDEDRFPLFVWNGRWQQIFTVRRPISMTLVAQSTNGAFSRWRGRCTRHGLWNTNTTYISHSNVQELIYNFEKVTLKYYRGPNLLQTIYDTRNSANRLTLTAAAAVSTFQFEFSSIMIFAPDEKLNCLGTFKSK